MYSESRVSSFTIFSFQVIINQGTDNHKVIIGHLCPRYIFLLENPADYMLSYLVIMRNTQTNINIAIRPALVH